MSEDKEFLNIDYAAIEERIMAHMAGDKQLRERYMSEINKDRPKEFTGECVYDVMEGLVRYRIEHLLMPHRTSNGYPRPYRLWSDDRPAYGGQWHTNVPSAIRRIDYETTGSWARKVGVLEGQVGSLERRLHEAQKEKRRTEEASQVGKERGAKLNWSPGHSENGDAGQNAKATISTPLHSEKIIVYGITLAEAESHRDLILESHHAIKSFVHAWRAAGFDRPGRVQSQSLTDAVSDLEKIAGDVTPGFVSLRQAMRMALEHVGHMTKWITRQNQKIINERLGFGWLGQQPDTYSFESLGEDMDTMETLAGMPRPAHGGTVTGRWGRPPNPNRE